MKLAKLTKNMREAVKNVPVKRIITFAMILGLFTLPMFAETNVFEDIAGTIAGYQEGVKKMIYAIATIVAIIGAFGIFHKMNNGDQDVKKTVMLVIGGCIGLIALAEALPAFFGY